MTGQEWSDGALEDLLQILLRGDSGAMGLWIAVHVGPDDDRWRDYAAALGSIAASSIETVARAELRASGWDPDEVDLVPVLAVDDPDPAVLDAGRILTLSLQNDVPGLRGVIAAARSRGALEDVCGAMAALAGMALRAEVEQDAAKGGA